MSRESAIEAQLLQRIARAICAHTDLRKPGDPDPVLDQPDDLVWLRNEDRIQPAPRWILYEKSARAALDAIGGASVVFALASIIDQVERGRGTDRLDRALDEIDKLARQALTAAVSV